MNGKEYQEPTAALEAIKHRVHEAENGIVFDENKNVSTSGNVAIRVVETEKGESFVKIGFRNEDTKKEFLETTSESLKGLEAQDVGYISGFLGPLNHKF